jgi:hypothetical protein
LHGCGLKPVKGNHRNICAGLVTDIGTIAAWTQGDVARAAAGRKSQCLLKLEVPVPTTSDDAIQEHEVTPAVRHEQMVQSDSPRTVRPRNLASSLHPRGGRRSLQQLVNRVWCSVRLQTEDSKAPTVKVADESKPHPDIDFDMARRERSRPRPASELWFALGGQREGANHTLTLDLRYRP